MIKLNIFSTPGLLLILCTIVLSSKLTADEKYYFVKSELGLSGLLREDLLVHANGRRLAISIASYLIPVHQPNATLEKPTKRFKIGRYGGDYFEVTGETEAGFYDVILYRDLVIDQDAG